jgi:hypothetical protein
VKGQPQELGSRILITREDSPTRQNVAFCASDPDCQLTVEATQNGYARRCCPAFQGPRTRARRYGVILVLMALLQNYRLLFAAWCQRWQLSLRRCRSG